MTLVSDNAALSRGGRVSRHLLCHVVSCLAQLLDRTDDRGALFLPQVRSANEDAE